MVIGFECKFEFAMGWWFYTIYVKIGFIKKLVEYNHTRDPKIKDEKALKDYTKGYLKMKKVRLR